MCLSGALFKGLCISENSGMVTSLIILKTVLFIELLWEILLILIGYVIHMQILNIYPISSNSVRLLSQTLSSPFLAMPLTSSVSLSNLLSISHQRMGIRIVPTSQGYYLDQMIYVKPSQQCLTCIQHSMDTCYHYYIQNILAHSFLFIEV